MTWRPPAQDKVDGEGDAPTSRQTMLFCLNSAIPFVVFGMLDNSIMLLGGDVVDDLVGSYFHLSTLACAAVANTFADVLGISIGNTVEALTVKLGLPEAHLTQAQARPPTCRGLRALRAMQTRTLFSKGRRSAALDVESGSMLFGGSFSVS